ncbi:MAG TPA: Zn-dependent hydrolase [Bacteroidales bacterium]|nr:Zn-dependent hydrolase [Bacteroidales bacterium]
MTHELSKNIEAFAESIQWFGQSSIKIQHAGRSIYIDPFNLKKDDVADVIFITHPHFDHYSEKDLKMILSSDTVMFCPNELVESSKQFGIEKVYGVGPGFESEWKGIGIKTVPAYNVLKTDKHPKEKGWVGYVLTFGHVKLYHAGDTERIPEMKDLDCDIVMLPLGQTYTMESVADAAAAVMDTTASIAIPIHFGMYEGKAQDAEQFKTLLSGKIEVKIPVMS